MSRDSSGGYSQEDWLRLLRYPDRDDRIYKGTRLAKVPGVVIYHYSDSKLGRDIRDQTRARKIAENPAFEAWCDRLEKAAEAAEQEFINRRNRLRKTA